MSETNHPPLTDLIGLDPNFTGGLSPEEHLRRLRCGECDEALSALAAAREELAAAKREIRTLTDSDDAQAVIAQGERDAARAEADKLRAELAEARKVIACRDAALDASTETHRIAQQIVLATLGGPAFTPERSMWDETALALLLHAKHVILGASRAHCADDPWRKDASRWVQNYDAFTACGDPEHAGQTCDEYDAALDAVPGDGEQAACGAVSPDLPFITCTYPAGHAPIPIDVRGVGVRPMEHGSTTYSTWWNGRTATVHGDALAGREQQNREIRAENAAIVLATTGDGEQAATTTELCSDKNGFHDGHDWTPDPCEPYRWCPGYPVPRTPNRTCGHTYIGNVGEFTCDLYTPHDGKHWNSLAEFAWGAVASARPETTGANGTVTPC